MKMPSSFRSRSRGIASILILLLVGMSLTAVVLGAGYYISSTQSQTVATHAQTQAQMKAWTGAEVIRRYFQQLQTDGQLGVLLSKSTPFDLRLQGDGVENVISARVTNMNANALTVQITGLTAVGSRAEASSILEVVYSTTGSGGGGSEGGGSGGGGSGGGNGAAGTCGAPRKASAVFRGDLNITGGGSSFLSGEEYSDIAVEGSITIKNAAQAIISGCSKRDITLSGGGIDDNATLISQSGTIKISSMSPAKGATLWAKDINISQEGGTYKAIKAGAYAVEVMVDGVKVGLANAGGQLIASTAAAGGIPWVKGTVVPWNSGTLLITLTDGGEYLVDMKKVAINATTGEVSGASEVAERLNSTGSKDLPDRFKLVSQALSGGDLYLKRDTVDHMWGYGLTIDGWGGAYGKVWPSGDLKVVTGSISEILGGGALWASSGGCSSPSNCWNFPTFANNGSIAGKIFYGGGKTALNGNLPKVAANVANVSPGLPGEAFCDTRTDNIDVTLFKSVANYVFHFDGGDPKLTIQHVKASNGSSIDRVAIDLKTVDHKTLQQIGGVDFLGCSWQSPSNLYNDALQCLRGATQAGGWNLKGITKFPPGVAWFEGPVIIDGVSSSSQSTLYNTILATGGVRLTSSGHVPLVAPNFVSPPSVLCDAPFYPSNLCDKSVSPSNFAEWTDGEGVKHRGVPLANMAIVTNNGLSTSGWDIQGGVMLGGALITEGAITSIKGNITVGANALSNSNISQGGIKHDTRGASSDQLFIPGSQCGGPSEPSTPGGTPSIDIKWARYL